MSKFHNPYNFVPAPRRKEQHETLGDKQPVGHTSYKTDLWSGRITVHLTTKTPLLAVDAGKSQRNTPVPGHHIFPTRVDADGFPYIPPTSIKGMLRAAYEAVTNSRMGVLEKHNQRLAYRAPASKGLKMVPARVEGNQVKLFFGTNIPQTQVGNDGSPNRWNKTGDPQRKNSVMHAAWVERHDVFGDLNQWHGKKVWAYIALWRHKRPDFDFWNIVELRDENDTRPRNTLKEQRNDFGRSSLLWPADASQNLPADPGYQPGRWVQGYVCTTGHNIDRKHDERVFFAGSGNPVSISIGSTEMQKLREDWKLLLESYEKAYAENGLVTEGIEPSRHIVRVVQEKELPDGTLCYASVQGNGRGGWQIRGLFPVMISRHMHELAPIDLLPSNLRPAKRLLDDAQNKRSEMSPADRVFGWVGQQGEGAYKGQLRVGIVKCLSQREDGALRREDFVLEFKDTQQQTVPLPLAILSTPKPQQVRFYVAKSDEGGAVTGGGEDKGVIGYKQGNGLRGRKVYPHHSKLPADYWNNPQQERTQINNNGYFQEYRHPNDYHKNSQGNAHQDGTNPRWKLTNQVVQNDQNRSIVNWIKSESRFAFTIDVTNLSAVELGALLWLLDVPDNTANPAQPRQRFHRLGGGKPLGFGSVKLVVDWEKTDLRNGAEWKQYYESLEDLANPHGLDSATRKAYFEHEAIKPFQSAVVAAYGKGAAPTFEDVSFIRAFLKAAEGFNDGLPIHYPRVRPSWLNNNQPVPPHPEGKSFEWFVQNERPQNQKLTLPDLDKDTGLPIYSE